MNFFASGGISCSILYKTSSLESSVHLLLKIAQEYYPINRINLISGSLELKIFIPICDTEPNGLSKVRETSHKFPIIGSEYPLTEPLIINDLDPYKEKAHKFDPTVTELPFFHHKSLLRIPLFITGSFTYLINFWSLQKNAFNHKSITEFKELTGPLSEQLSVDFTAYCSEPPAEKPAEAQKFSAYRQISKLKGLSSVKNKIDKVANTDSSVLILGETGVGKELIAQAIHEKSRRKDGPYICINCGSIPQSLIESELFGYEKGAFTGAVSQKKGFFEFAQNGTIFLDEIGEMPLTSQVHLLRVLEQKTIQRIGNPAAIPINVRVIAATNQNIIQMIEDKTFRKDLYYRLAVYPIHVPALRERKEDILPLAKFFIKQKAEELNTSLPSLSQTETEKLFSYDWPGNIRELKQLIERAVIDSRSGSVICPLTIQINEPRQAECRLFEKLNWPTLNELENMYIQAVMQKTGGKLTGKNGASEILGIHYTTLHKKLTSGPK